MTQQHDNQVSTPGDSRAAVWVFVLLLLLVNLPNLMPWEYQIYPETWWMDAVDRLFKCLLIAALVLSLYSRPWKAWLVIWLLVGWWMPASIAVRVISESPITSSLVGMAMASSPAELWSLLSSLPVPFWLGALAWNLASMGLVFWLRQHPDWRWKSSLRLRVFIIAAALLLAPVVLGMSRASPSAAETAREAEQADPFAAADKPIGVDGDLPFAFPYELAWAAAQYWQARQVVDVARAGLRRPAPAEELVVGDGAPEVVVLVIGESSARGAWRLFNPDAPATTPRLGERQRRDAGLHLFTNVVAQSTSTRQAVPSMLTPQPLLWPDGKPNAAATQSIVSLATRAGYATAWFSNQSAVGRYDGVIAAYADEAQTTAFLNPSSFFNQGSLDEVLLPAWQRHMASRPKVFAVLHTMGSHFRFEHRYPAGFGLFPDSQDPKETYFNSVAYTDQLLDAVIRALEADGRSAVMLYLSDHGQGLAGDECERSEINRVTADAYEVPALVWMSASYLGQHPKAGRRLSDNAAAPYTTAAVYQTLRDLMAGDTLSADPDGATRLPSFLRRPSTGARQMVVAPSMVWVDFQEAAARDRCLIKPQ